MAWYDNAVFYHIYPIGLCGCKHENDGVAENHFDKLNEWAEHAAKIGCTGIYIGPLFESEGHGYETVDYRKVDTRLGTNEDFKNFVAHCHDMGVKVIVDGVFNHTGRGFFAFQDLKANRENSRYRDWYCNVNFYGNNEYNDGFSYDNWGGYNLLVKLNQRNPEVKNYIFDSIRMWAKEFDIDGIRLDAADVLDHDFMREMRGVTDSLKQDFWLMGEVIHGDYSRWANGQMLHSVTNYELHKALFSGHNDHNYFEIAHSIKRLLGICGDTKLYTFVDNHDVERIYSKLNNKAHMKNVMILDYMVPGIPSIYYGSEFGIEGRKENGGDWNLRPCLELKDFDKPEYKPLIELITKLGNIKKDFKEVSYGEYKELLLTNRQFAFARILDGKAIVTVLNNDDNCSHLEIGLPVGAQSAVDLLSAPLKEEPQIEVMKEDEQAVVNTQLVDLLTKQAQKAQNLCGMINQAKEEAQSAVDVKDICDNVDKLVNELSQLSKESIKIVSPEDTVCFTEDTTGCSEVKIDNGRLIVDVPANSGMVIALR